MKALEKLLLVKETIIQLVVYWISCISKKLQINRNKFK